MSTDGLLRQVQIIFVHLEGMGILHRQVEHSTNGGPSKCGWQQVQPFHIIGSASIALWDLCLMLHQALLSQRRLPAIRY